MYSQIQQIISSGLTWEELTPEQKALFKSQEEFDSFASVFETGSTVDAALLKNLVSQMQENIDLQAALPNYSPDQRALIEKMVKIRIEQIRLEQIQKNQLALNKIKPETDRLNPKQDPRREIVKIVNQIIPPSNKTATKTFIDLAITSNLDLSDSKDLGLAVAIALNGNEPIATTYRQISKAIVVATNQDYQQAITNPQPGKILDPQNNLLVNTPVISPPDTTLIVESSQKIISQITSKNNDPGDISDPLVVEIKKLKEIENNQEAQKISHTLITQISDKQLNQIIRLINQVDPSILQNPSSNGEKAAAIINQVYPKNTFLSPQTTKLYSQGLTSNQWAKIYQNAAIQKIITPQQALIVKQQLKTLDNSNLGQEIHQPLFGITRRFQTLTNKVSAVLPQGFTKPINFIFHPAQSIKNWFGKKIGQYLGKKLSKTLVNQGIKTLVKLGLKTALQTAAQLLNIGVPGLGFVAAAAIKIAGLILKKGQQVFNNIWRSLTGEDFNPKLALGSLAALPVMAATGLAGFFSTIGAATVTAAASAGTTIVIAAAAGVFIYITAFAVAPLISTIAQLESQPSSTYSITSPSGPIPPGCPSGWPIPAGKITQGPKTLSTHYGAEAIDIGADFGTPIFSTHPGRAFAVDSSGPYGKYVDVFGICKGISFTTRYAHLPFVSFYGEKIVAAGEQIGIVDNTGNSTGNHLHYEIKASALGDINQFIPKPIPVGCIEYSQCQVTIP